MFITGVFNKCLHRKIKCPRILALNVVYHAILLYTRYNIPLGVISIASGSEDPFMGTPFLQDLKSLDIQCQNE